MARAPGSVTGANLQQVAEAAHGDDFHVGVFEFLAYPVYIHLDGGVAKIGYKAPGGQFEETKITSNDQTETFDKGTLVIVFEDYTALHKAVPKKK